MSTRFVIEVQRWQIMGAISYIKKLSAPGAFLIGKMVKRAEAFLEAFPSADSFRLTAEAITDKEPLKEDRASEEERHV